jgi:hypothetical protein
MTQSDTDKRAIVQRATFWLPVVLIALTTAYFFTFVGQHAINAPYQDEIPDFLVFMVNVVQSDSIGQALSEWNQNFNEHRTNTTRLIIYLAYVIEGNLNFHTLAMVANCSLLMIIFTFYFPLRHLEYRLVYLAAAALFLLNIRTSTILLWSQPTFAYCFVVAFSFAALCLLHRVTLPKLLAAAAFAVLGSWTFATGLLAWPIGAAMLLQQRLFGSGSSWRFLVIWLIAGLITLGLWLHGHEPPVSKLDDPYARAMMKQILDQVLVDPTWGELIERFAGFFFTLLGSAFFVSNVCLAGLLGSAMFLWLTYISLRSIKATDTRLLALAWFTVASAVAITYGRAMYASPDYILDTRYSFISVVFICALTLLTVSRLKASTAIPGFCLCIAASVFCVWTYTEFQDPINERLQQRRDFFNAERYIAFGTPAKRSNEIVHNAIELGIYRPPCRPQPACGSARSPAIQE